MNDTRITRNITAQMKHRREVFWQIVLPIIVGCLCAGSMVALVIINDLNGGSNSQAADTSLIFMIIPMMACSLVPFVVFAGIAFGLSQAIKAIPPYAKQALDALQRVNARVNRGSNQVTDPLIRMQSRGAGFRAMLRRKEDKRAGDPAVKEGNQNE